MSALYLKDLAQKTRRGLEGRVRRGWLAGGLSYGYRIVRRIGPDGAPTTGEREVEPKEAEVVRSIFADFAAGKEPESDREGFERPWRQGAVRRSRGGRRPSTAIGGAAPAS